MKAVVIREYGTPQVLRLEDIAEPALHPGEVLVQVAAAGVNPVDTMERAGLTKDYKPVAFPGVLGWDLAGTVLAMGSGVTGLREGDRVFAWADHSYAERCVVSAALLAKVPEGLELTQAAALPLVGLTGSQLIARGAAVLAGQRVLVSGAVGGVGRAAVFEAKRRGAIVIAGVATRQLALAELLGADEVLALDNADALAAFAQVDAVANTVRGDTARALLDKVKPGGIFASATGAPAQAGAYPSVRVVSFVSRQDTAGLQALGVAARDKLWTVPVTQRLPLAAASQAHAMLERGGAGKLILLP